METDSREVGFSYSSERLQSGCVLYQLTRNSSAASSYELRGPKVQIGMNLEKSTIASTVELVSSLRALRYPKKDRLSGR